MSAARWCGLRRLLRPRGRLLIEMHSWDELVRWFTPAPFAHVTLVGDDLQIDTTTFA